LFGKTFAGFTGFAPAHQLPEKDYNPFLKTLKVMGEIFIPLFIPWLFTVEFSALSLI
jgi:hypothetical protein